jgi:hypothetical protein
MVNDQPQSTVVDQSDQSTVVDQCDQSVEHTVIDKPQPAFIGKFGRSLKSVGDKLVSIAADISPGSSNSSKS